MSAKRLYGFEQHRGFKDFCPIICLLVSLAGCKTPAEGTDDTVATETVPSGPTVSSLVATEFVAPGASGYLNPKAFHVPHDVTWPSGKDTSAVDTLSALAEFAWQEFIALNWPSNYTNTVPTRGVPDSSKTLLEFLQPDSDPRVWQTYMHRVEIFPEENLSLETYPIPDSFNVAPSYHYGSATGGSIMACGPYMPDSLAWAIDSEQPPLRKLLTLFNNLDETTEIDLATMFVDEDPNALGTPAPSETPIWFNLPTQPRRFIYQAKANRVMADYIRMNSLYDKSVRDDWATRTYTAVRDSFQGGLPVCPDKMQGDEIICFPPGVIGGSEGMMEVKATWRQLTLQEAASGRFLIGDIIRYRNTHPSLDDSTLARPTPAGTTVTDSTLCYEVISATPTATTTPYGLVGLHIIHKTTNVPTFVFATFEQIDNLDKSVENNQLFYYNRQDQIVNPDRQNVNERAHPISAAVDDVNQQVRFQIRKALAANGLPTRNSVWLYYKLVGVQGTASFTQPDHDFYLANIVTETNEILRSFSGTLNQELGTIDPRVNNLYRGNEPFVTGGCKGCHGNAQVGPSPQALTQNPDAPKTATDFSFITKNAPFGGIPDAINQPLIALTEN